jgi:hypothetical protein
MKNEIKEINLGLSNSLLLNLAKFHQQSYTFVENET